MTPFNDSIGNSMFTIMPVIIIIMFILVFGFILFNIVKGISIWNHNNAEPRLTVLAKMVSKRVDISTHMRNDNDNFSQIQSTSRYFVTFEVESGDRIEFHVDGNKYGMLVEEDKGNLTFQGTRYLGFERAIWLYKFIIAKILTGN